MTILFKHPLALALFLIAAASNFNPASAGTAFGTTDELEIAVNSFCAGTFDEDASPAYGPIEDWDVSRITDMESIFYEQGSCNPPIGDWDVSNVTNFSFMFALALAFNQDISSWDVSKGTRFNGMFSGATAFNQEISDWDVSSGIYFNSMFTGATAFNQEDTFKWDVSKGTNFDYMFFGATAFNQDISGWDVGSGTTFAYMFYYATAFNQDISDWDVSSAESLDFMFRGATAFNQDISDWDVGNGINFRFMFGGATAFNQDISSWDVSKGIYFNGMFSGATAFNQDISDWDVSSAGSLTFMFQGATAFNQDISSWDVSKVFFFYKFLEGATSFDQPSIYCKWQEINNAFKDETNVCDGAITCGWGDDTNCPQPSIGGGGDPHYDMPNSQTLTVQALCELRVAASDNIYGSKLEMHTRHAEPQDQKAGKEYTVISHISLKLDDDVYELEGKSGNLYKNGELFDLDYHLGDSAIESAGPYTITKSIAGRKKNQIQFFFVFVDGSTIMLRANVRFKMAYFNINGRFGGARMRGLLGDTHGVIKGGLYKRNGELMAKTVKQVDIEEYANEWQVLESDAKLFRDPDYFPRAPHQCVFLDSGHGFLKSDGDIDGIANTLRANRRRLMEEDPLEKAEKLAQAENVCTNRQKFDQCVEDVINVGIAIADDIYYD